MLILKEAIFLFIIGSLFGYIFEVIVLLFDKRKLINPGFLKGPYLLLHGLGFLMLFLISSLQINFAIKAIILMISPTVLELIAGLMIFPYYKIPSWDYSAKYFNYKGMISLPTSIGWAFLSLAFYYFIYPILIKLLPYASNKFVIIFMIIFFIIFTVDMIISIKRNIFKK